MNDVFSYHPTPVQELSHHPVADRAGVRILLKREDLNHPVVSGNKWWKLKYNLEAVLQTTHRTLLTFGGAYSNHIYATAAAASALNLHAIGVIRGEEYRPLNATLQFATDNGMQLHYVDRTTYRNKSSYKFQQWLGERFGSFMSIPEGGTNQLALKGCAEFAANELKPISFDHLYLAVGTGGTMAGIICGLADEKRHVAGIPVLKGGGFLEEVISNFIMEFSGRGYNNWSLRTDFHHGGYGKTTRELLSFIDEMKTRYDTPLDHVYTGKLLWAVMQQINSGTFKRGETILILHSGGMQAAHAFRQHSLITP